VRSGLGFWGSDFSVSATVDAGVMADNSKVGSWPMLDTFFFLPLFFDQVPVTSHNPSLIFIVYTSADDFKKHPDG